MYAIVEREELEEAVKSCRITCPRCGASRYILCSADLLAYECSLCGYANSLKDLRLYYRHYIVELKEYKNNYDIMSFLPSNAEVLGVYALLGVDPPGYSYKLFRYELNGYKYSALLYAFFEVLKTVDAEDECQLLKVAEEHKNAKI